MSNAKLAFVLVALAALAFAGYAYYSSNHPNTAIGEVASKLGLGLTPEKVVEKSHEANENVRTLVARIRITEHVAEGVPGFLPNYETYLYERPNYAILRNGYVLLRYDGKAYVSVPKLNTTFELEGEKVVVNDSPVTDAYHYVEDGVGNLSKTLEERDGHYVLKIVNETQGVVYYVYVNESNYMVDEVVTSFPNSQLIENVTYVIHPTKVNVKLPPLSRFLYRKVVKVNETQLANVLARVVWGNVTGVSNVSGNVTEPKENVTG